jgi:hypothetical protein
VLLVEVINYFTNIAYFPGLAMKRGNNLIEIKR